MWPHLLQMVPYNGPHTRSVLVRLGLFYGWNNSRHIWEISMGSIHVFANYLSNNSLRTLSFNWSDWNAHVLPVAKQLKGAETRVKLCKTQSVLKGHWHLIALSHTCAICFVSPIMVTQQLHAAITDIGERPTGISLNLLLSWDVWE